MDISVISSALTSVKTASDIAKLLKDSTHSLEQAEAKLKLADLISALADTRMQIAEITETLAQKDGEIRSLNEALLRKSQLEWEKPYYWVVVDDGKDGPFCQKCHDTDSKLVRLQGGNNGVWSCLSCKSSFYDKSYVRPKPVQLRNVRTW